MKKIVVWSWSYTSILSIMFAFLIYWCLFSFKEGYAEELTYWLFFPPIILVMLLILSIQFTTITCDNQQLIIYNLGKFRKRVFDIDKIDVSYGLRVKPSYKAPSMFPLYIYDTVSGKRYRIICGHLRMDAFDLFWKKYGPTN
ncbi:hypothetical protein ACTXNW_18475 [Enterococcus malodoratus]|uniref:hypothetical protein n=1 Tax=Enterococcus malodoratus TaxID=71451 RepID=UPI0020738C2D|nr:hypothetical protein [Enterococcus malodoratus]